MGLSVVSVWNMARNMDIIIVITYIGSACHSTQYFIIYENAEDMLQTTLQTSASGTRAQGFDRDTRRVPDPQSCWWSTFET